MIEPVDVVFNDIEFTSGEYDYQDFQEDIDEVYLQDRSTYSESLVDSTPFFLGMKVGGVAVILSLGTAVIITIFKKLGSTM